MKVIHVGTIDEGGAYQAMVRISDSMRRQGIDSSILLRTQKHNNSQGRKCIWGINVFFSKIKNVINNVLGEKNIHIDLLGTNIFKNQYVQEADIVFLHWTNSFISYNTILKFAKLQRKVVWVMHDMWLLTGGCHYDGYCVQYTQKCGNCPYTQSKWKKYLIFRCYERKRMVLKKLDPVLVMPSNWLAGCANDSLITKKLTKYVIPNPINNFFYKKNSKLLFSKQYHLKIDSKIILFGAMHATINSNKGFHYLEKALEINERDDLVLVVLGNDENIELRKYIGKVPVIYCGMIKELSVLNEIYNSADVFVAPSQQENYSNSVLEAMSCGVPVVAFDVGGMKDLIIHQRSGYLAEYENVQELLDGIDYCIANRDKLSENALADRAIHNSMDVIGRKYYQLCMKLLIA